MPNFAQGKIYRINAGNHYYVGSTTLSLQQRFANHKQEIAKPSKLYSMMREVGPENCSIELLAECPCENRAQLNECEEKHLLALRGENCLNMRRARRGV